MPGQNRTGFLHRINKDGAYETVCVACMKVISKQATETELEADEATHRALCSELMLNEALDYFRYQPVPKAGKK